MDFVDLYFLEIEKKSKFFTNLSINIDFLAYSLEKQFFLYKYFCQNVTEILKNGDLWLKLPVISKVSARDWKFREFP